MNRWPHGYAYEYNSLFDQFWLDGTETPCQVARKPFGRLAIANSDADAYAYTDCAIDQAYRAVQELKKINRGAGAARVEFCAAQKRRSCPVQPAGEGAHATHTGGSYAYPFT